MAFWNFSKKDPDEEPELSDYLEMENPITEENVKGLAEKFMFFKKAALLSGVLWSWHLGNYFLDTPNKENYDEKYELPKEIVVEDTTFPHTEREVIKVDDEGKEYVELEKIIDTSEIDLSKKFEIKTDRYTLSNGEDFVVFEYIGKFLGRAGYVNLFADFNFAAGPDEDRIRSVLSTLEENKDIEGLTFRFGGNEVIKDFERLFNDEEVKERNNIFSRALFSPLQLFHETTRQLLRWDYYNPMTQTAVGYSNIESLLFKQIGRHQDYQRFENDFEYTFLTSNPVGRLFKEYQALTNSKDFTVEEDNSYHLRRYLLLSALPVLMSGVSLSRRWIKTQKKKSNAEQGIHKKKINVENHEIAREFIHRGLSFGAGYGALLYSAGNDYSQAINLAAMIGAYFGTHTITKTIFDKIWPYSYNAIDEGKAVAKGLIYSGKKIGSVLKPATLGTFYFAKALYDDRKSEG